MIPNLNSLLKSFTLRQRTHNLLLSTILSSQFSSAASPASYENKQKVLIRNYNLNFEADGWIVNLYPYYPEIYPKKQAHVFEISNRYASLVMNFIRKERDFENSWAQRKTMYLKYDDVAMVTLLKPGSNMSIKLSHLTSSYPYSQLKRTITMTDLTPDQKIAITYEQQTKSGNNNTNSNSKQSFSSKSKSKQTPASSSSPAKPIHISMAYKQYRVMHKLIQKSMFEMSGWKYMAEFTKKQQMSKLDEKVESDRAMDDLFKDGPQTTGSM